MWSYIYAILSGLSFIINKRKLYTYPKKDIYCLLDNTFLSFLKIESFFIPLY